MRVFVAAWPPPAVVDLLAALPRPAVPGVRWTTADQWHVTLRFLGEVEGPAAAAAALAALGPSTPATPVVLGPVAEVLGGRSLVAPVAGLDAVAAAVEAATATIGRRPDPRGFRGHLTLARTGRARASLPSGAAVSASWVVGEVTLVRSHLGGGGARYEVLERVALQGPPPG